MNRKLILVLCLHISLVYCAPMKLQLLPMQYGMQQQNLMQLQNPFFRQAVPNLQVPFMYPQQPMMILLQNTASVAEPDDRYINLNEEHSTNHHKSNKGHIDESNEAIVLDAETTAEDRVDIKKTVVNPNGKYLIGQIISAIPFLPIEINVPDTIGWIAGLFPPNWFGRPGQNANNTPRISNKGPMMNMPILVVPAQMMAQY